MQVESNTRRIKSARHALEAYLDTVDQNLDSNAAEQQITDLVTDLFHLAHNKGVDYAGIVYRAREHFLAELQERETAANKHGRSIKNPPIGPSPLYNQKGEQIREVTQDEIDWTH